MNYEVIVSGAVAGAGDTVGIHPELPVTPEQIAAAVVGAAKGGASVAHIHVRDPQTGAPSRKLEYYREGVDRIREFVLGVAAAFALRRGGTLPRGAARQPRDRARPAPVRAGSAAHRSQGQTILAGGHVFG